MRNYLFTLALALFMVSPALADRLKPFVLASVSDTALELAVEQTRDSLSGAGFRVLGDYRPYAGAAVLVATSDELQTAAQGVETGTWASVMRVAVTATDTGTQISFTNPEYLAAAYRLKTDLASVRMTLEQALGYAEDFGADRGEKADSLGNYRYMFGMERVDDTYRLATFDDHAEALAAVEAGLAQGVAGTTRIYRLDLDATTTLFGIGMSGDAPDKYRDDTYQMSIVDFEEVKRTAYLPYEVRVVDGEVTALHMRYRMALHFPDLSMMGKHSFMTLMPSPDAIEEALAAISQAPAK